MISILKSPWSLLCLGPFCPLVPFGHGPFCPLVPFGYGPFWVLVPFGWSLLAGLFWPVSFGQSILAGPFWSVPYGLVPFDFQRLLVLLVCVRSRNWGYSRSLSLVWMVICSVISTNSSTLHSSCLPRMEAIKKSHNKSYCFFFRENKATKILWAKEVINNS